MVNLKDERQKMTDSRPPELVLESHAMLVKTSKIQLPQMQQASRVDLNQSFERHGARNGQSIDSLNQYFKQGTATRRKKATAVTAIGKHSGIFYGLILFEIPHFREYKANENAISMAILNHLLSIL